MWYSSISRSINQALWRSTVQNALDFPSLSGRSTLSFTKDYKLPWKLLKILLHWVSVSSLCLSLFFISWYFADESTGMLLGYLKSCCKAEGRWIPWYLVICVHTHQRASILTCTISWTGWIVQKLLLLTVFLIFCFRPSAPCELQFWVRKTF